MTKEEVLRELEVSETKGYNIWSKEWDRSHTHGNECEHCGRKCGDNPLQVHVTIDGTVIPNKINESDLKIAGVESQGCWNIGNGCAKKMFGKELEQYTFKFNPELCKNIPPANGGHF